MALLSRRRQNPLSIAEADFNAAHPSTAALIIEIAVSSPALGRENASLYAEADVKEYWIVLGSERRVEVYHRPEQGLYRDKQVFGIEATLQCNCLPTIRIQVSQLFV